MKHDIAFAFLREKWLLACFFEREAAFRIFRDAWKGQFLLREAVFTRGIGDHLSIGTVTNDRRPKLSLWGVIIFFKKIFMRTFSSWNELSWQAADGASLWQANQKSPYGTMEQSTWPVLNCALPSSGQGQFVSPAIRSGFECVHRWSQQHDLSARMASFLRFTAL